MSGKTLNFRRFRQAAGTEFRRIRLPKIWLTAENFVCLNICSPKFCQFHHHPIHIQAAASLWARFVTSSLTVLSSTPTTTRTSRVVIGVISRGDGVGRRVVGGIWVLGPSNGNLYKDIRMITLVDPMSIILQVKTLKFETSYICHPECHFFPGSMASSDHF